MASKAKSNPQKPVKRIKILKVKTTERKSLLIEYFYPILGVLFVLLAATLYSAGYHFDESVVIALWVAAIIFAIKQVWRFMKGDADETKNGKKAEKPKEPLASLPKDYKPPETPRVSRDFSPLPPAGDKRYPPPSPFIKPPK